MTTLLPSSFPELLAGLIALAAVSLAIASLRSRLRNHATRMFAILFAASIALFSNHWTTYFAALFIVATAVTELEFLQNLAAIIRGNKPYFDYKKEQLSPEEADRRIDLDSHPAFADEEARSRAGGDERRGRTRLSRAMFRAVVEQLAAKKLSEVFGAPVELQVRFASNGLRVEVQGVIQGNATTRDRLFGFEFVRKRVIISQCIDAVRRLDELAPKYSVITRRSCEGHLVVIILDDTDFPDHAVKDIQAVIDRSQHVVSLRVLTRKVIGLDLIDERVWQEVG
jgi:hypothetical protein